ncbi:MAG TPA: TIGR03790 family protein [Bryobacteraceae bacterium]|nr:TIGR03790 family protein [Bryobacteraceae bacterium]
MRGSLCALIFALLFPVRTFAQYPLASRTLVIYAVNDPDSVSIANYYQAKRGIPSANMCPLNLTAPNSPGVSAFDYTISVKSPIQQCLNSVGPQNILYLVLAYMRPYVLDPGGGLDNYALDSYLADIWDQYTTQNFNPFPTRNQPYYADNQSQGDTYAPFRTLAQYRALGTLPLIYSVWRLDGATPAIAQGLIDNALAAESAGGPISQNNGTPVSACLDMALDPTTSPDDGYRAADWDLYRAAQFLSLSNSFNVITDTQSTTFGNPPSPACPNTGLYAGWYNYGSYNNAFSWNPGSIGWDLDSGALFDPRGGIWWGPNALINGVTVTTGPNTEPYLEGLVRPSGVMLNLLQGANVGDAFLRNTRWLKWRIMNVGDPLYTPFVRSLPPFDAGPSLDSFSFSPRELVGGDAPVSVVISLASPAPAEGLTFTFSSNSSAITLPESITVPGGSNSVSFLATANAVDYGTEAIVTAVSPSVTASNTMVVDPLLSGIELPVDSVQGGQPVQATLYLNKSAPLGGLTVQLSSDTPNAATLPGSLTVPAGLSAVNLTVTTYAVAGNTTVRLTSRYGGSAPQVTLTVTP